MGTIAVIAAAEIATERDGLRGLADRREAPVSIQP
jgi:hypothetical protein